MALLELRTGLKMQGLRGPSQCEWPLEGRVGDTGEQNEQDGTDGVSPVHSPGSTPVAPSPFLLVLSSGKRFDGFSFDGILVW